MGQYKQNKSKNPLRQQKHAVRIINNRTGFEHAKELFKSKEILDICKLNILSVAVFLYQMRDITASLTFSKSFERSTMDTQQVFHFLIIKLLKPHVPKLNSKSDLEGLTSGISF